MMSKIQILKAIHNLTRTPTPANRLFMMSKIQILKAIHNKPIQHINSVEAVYDVKDTNFESNSQLHGLTNVDETGCL